MAGRFKSRGGAKGANFLTLLLLCTLILSIVVLSSFLNKKGTSLDIREQAVYLTPTPSYFYSLKVSKCSLPANSKPDAQCQGKVTWASSGLKAPALYQKIAATVSYLTSDPSGERDYHMTNTAPANCVTFILADGSTTKVSKKVCIDYLPDCGLLPCP